MRAAWRTRSAVPVVPWHNLVTVSSPTGMRRGASAFTGMACSSSASAADTGSWRWASRTVASRIHSHWHAAFSMRRCSSVPRRIGGPDKASPAPWRAAVRAHRPSSSSRARVIGAEVITGAHSERAARAPSRPVAKWVCSRSRPAVSDITAASSPLAARLVRGRLRRGLAAWAARRNPAAYSAASWAWMAARGHPPSVRSWRAGYPVNAEVMSAQYRLITSTTSFRLRMTSWSCPARALARFRLLTGAGGLTAWSSWLAASLDRSPNVALPVTAAPALLRAASRPRRRGGRRWRTPPGHRRRPTGPRPRSAC